MVELALSGGRRSDERSVDAGPFPPPLDPDAR